MPASIIARWTNWAGQGLEHLVLRQLPGCQAAESVIIGADKGSAWQYAVICDQGWRLRSARLHRIGQDRSVELRSDGAGRWTDGVGRHLPDLDGAIDLDISGTPFTNTLPIRRLRLREGQSAELRMACLDLEKLTVGLRMQRYTCLETGRRYRFEALEPVFEAELTVDEAGLVRDYPGLFRRCAAA